MSDLLDWLPGWWREYPDQVLRLGNSHFGKFTQWSPDRELNPQYEGIPDINPAGLLIAHITTAGRVCKSHVAFAAMKAVEPDGHPTWDVLSLDPLHLEPSILCKAPHPEGICNDHGWIRGGLWVAA